MSSRAFVERGAFARWREDRGTRGETEAIHRDLRPGEVGTIAVLRERVLTLEEARWGLMPYWATAPKYKPDFGRKNAYEADAETVFDKPTFRAAAKYRRCLVPLTAFYERAHGRWLRMQYKDPDAFSVAGLFADPEPGVSEITTFAIVITDANETIADACERMPVVLARESEEVWLDPWNNLETLSRLLVPSPPDWFTVKDGGPIAQPNQR